MLEGGCVVVDVINYNVDIVDKDGVGVGHFVVVVVDLLMLLLLLLLLHEDGVTFDAFVLKGFKFLSTIKPSHFRIIIIIIINFFF